MICRADSPYEIFPECEWCAANVGKLSLWGNLGLFAIKLVCGAAGDSRAVIADAVHSAADVALALILLICLRVSAEPPDHEHPYGHGNVEYVASLFVGLSLSTVALLITYAAVGDLMHGVTSQPSLVALLGLLISIIGNEIMFRHSLCCGQRYRSPAMIANAWENRADVYSTLAALVGVVAAQFGWLFMDPIAAVLVAALLMYSAVKMMRTAWQGILGHAAEESYEQQIRRLASDVAGVEGIASLKTRNMGQYIGVDLKVVVAEELTLVDGCAICERVKQALGERVERLGLVNVVPVGKSGTDDR